MKRAIRIVILTVGVLGTFMAAAVQQVPAQDGGPLILCPPKQPKLHINPAEVDSWAGCDREVTNVSDCFLV